MFRLQSHDSIVEATFDGEGLAENMENFGWRAGKGRKGALLLGNKPLTEAENKYIAFHSQQKVHNTKAMLFICLVVNKYSGLWSVAKGDCYMEQWESRSV